MRKIENEMCEALNTGTEWRGDNTEVSCIGSVRLHGNLIAKNVGSDQCEVSFSGRKTRTTASRLAAIIAFFGYEPVDGFVPSASRKNGVDANRWYILRRN